MTQLPPDQTPEGWNKTSRAYDDNLWEFMRPYVEEVARRADPGPEHDVLDVAAGNGAVTLAVAPKARHVLATDFADEMLERLRARLEQQPLDNVSIERMDAQALTVDDASFDIVCSNFGVIFFPDRVKGLSEMRRALRPGGRAVLTAWSRPERFELFALIMGAIQTALPDLPKPPAPPPVFSLADPAQFERELRDAGFEDVAVETVRHTYEAGPQEQFWEQIRFSAPPTIALFERVGEDGEARVRSVFEKMLRERFGDGPIRLTNEAHVAVARR